MQDITFLTNKKIPQLPETLENNQVTYELYSSLITTTISKTNYTLTEPQLNENDQDHYEKTKQALIETINFELNGESNLTNLKNTIDPIQKELHIKLNPEQYQKIFYILYIEFLGLWRIQPLIHDPLIKKITISLNSPVLVEHQFYGTLTTNITTTQDDFDKIESKLKVIKEELKLQVVSSKNNIQITKPIIKNPLTLIKEKKAAPEMLAFLWMLIEHRKPILFTEDYLEIANFFLPSNTKVLTNEENLHINNLTEYTFSTTPEQENFALLNNTTYTGPGTPILISKQIDEFNYFVFYTINNSIYKIKEKGKEVFLKKDEKFYHDYKQSIFLNTENLIKELELRTRLIVTLAHNNLDLTNFRKVISIYYRDRTAVLKKAGLI
jgi:hypothetical protein